MSKSQAVGSMSEWSGTLKEMHRQIGDGSLTLQHLKKFVEHQNPFAITNIREEWQEFYRKYFRITVDFSEVIIPEEKEDFTRVIFIPKGLTFAQITKAIKKHFKVWLYNDNLDKIITENVRIPDNSYAILIRDRIEADKELKNLSADQIKAKGINTITLMERFIYELKYWDETHEHLDVQNVTLCAGSRDSDGHVPDVRWYDDRLLVDWCFLDYASVRLRARAVVS